MILAFCVEGGEQPLQLHERFGRAHSFAIVEASRASGKGKVLKTVENSGRDLPSAAGTGAIQLLVNEGVEGIVAPHLGPKAEDARVKLGLKLWSQGDYNNVDDALAAWMADNLEELSNSVKPEGLYRA